MTTMRRSNLYRIAQEAVGNAIKHGHGQEIVVGSTSRGQEKMLRVIDDGSGLPSTQVNGKEWD